MKRISLGTLAGALLFQQLPELPHPVWGVGFGLTLALALLLRSRLLAGFLFGLAWTFVYVVTTWPNPLPTHREKLDVQVEGVVGSLVERRRDGARFFLDVTRIRSATGVWEGCWRLRLNWYNPPPTLVPDQGWRLNVRLRRPHGLHNPGGYDYELWLFRHQVSATGYVRSADGLITPRAGSYPLLRLRQGVSDRIAARLSSDAESGVIRALLVGDRSGIEPQMWQVFRNSGTSHLMAISGLHIGLVAWAVATMTGLLWRTSSFLCARWPAPLAAVTIGTLAATGYAALAGFSLPTQRALLMLFMVAVAMLRRRNIAMSQLLALAALAALLREPTAVSTPGFWLSFGAVTLIILALQDRRRGGRLRRWWRIQWVLTLGLAPVLVCFGFSVPLHGALANLLAIPWYGFLVVPTILLSATLQLVHEPTGVWLLEVAASLIHWSLPVLEWLGSWPVFAPLLPVPTVASLALAGIGVVLWAAPPGLPGRYLAPVFTLPLMFGVIGSERLKLGDFRLTVLDVGQGLATVVETRAHALIFDTGPGYNNGYDTGSRVIVPYLRQERVDALDGVILSHADNDHVGGTAGLLRELAVAQIWAGESEDRIPGRAEPCPDGYAWRWDGVTFTLWHPMGSGQTVGNDASCVLKVANSGGSVLLTGDIEELAERRLLEEHATRLRSGVVVAPHHGSRTSSSPAFVKAVGPEYVVYSAGYLNRFGFPAPEVVARWRAVGAVGLNTADSGAIQVVVRNTTGLQHPLAFRRRQRRYWHVDSSVRRKLAHIGQGDVSRYDNGF